MREASTPWPILVAEVMSQQTQIERIGPAWERFVTRWPKPAALADADAGEVVQAWAGLGYNRRALALHRAARAIVRDHGGLVPAGVAALEALPGIGPYTARAVAASAFGQPVAPLDVNVRRVVGRLLGRSGSERGLQDAADTLVDRRRPRAWVDAVMDLASGTCTRRAPRCDACPVRAMCRSRGTTGETPRPRTTATPRFASTNRWLRGRLLAMVREAPDRAWIALPGALGEHDAVAVGAAVRALESEGFLEVRAGRARLRSAR
jgi:A/G-specific adenine glycosylase